MAETILYNTVTEIIKKLGSAVLQEIGLAWGVKGELHKLEETVSTIRAVLVDAEEQQATTCEVADWLEKLNDAFYDADDLLDDFPTEVLRRQVMTQNKRLKKVRIFFSSSNQLAFSSRMAQDIKVIRKRLATIAENRKNFHLIEQPIELRVENTKREETHSFVLAESVIGRDGDKNSIVEMLLDNNIQQSVSVVAIVGIGGLGKTTLAQLIYNDEEVTKYFELKMWVCVSDPFDVKLIAQKIIGIEACKGLTFEDVQIRLRDKIDGKKYLLVLDDVWNENHYNWLKLREILMGGSTGSKILVTTRTELVANVTRANSLYVLEGLSEMESWSLFKQLAFKQGEESENPCRVTMGKEIVKKCKGVPLAIKAIGSLLYSKDTDAEWLLFKNNDLLKIAQEEDVILPILKLSYDHLPSNLKRCFAFCSLYSKDEKISKRELIQLWVANGFIQLGYENQQLEDVGEMYFMNLLRRSLFQDVGRDKWGDIISCKMHDLVHDLAQSVTRLENSTLNSGAENVTERSRHVSFGYPVNSSFEIPTHLMRANKLRTFILKNQDLKETVFERIVSNYKCLRVLDLSKLNIKTVPSYISKLKHLRYLDLSGNVITTLSNSITKLQNLQALKLNKCCTLVELPRDFQKLVSLRHLELDECDALTGMPHGLGQLTSLVTLTRFVVDSNSGSLNELGSLNNLGGALKIVRPRRDSSSQCVENATAAAEMIKKTHYLEGKEYLKSLSLYYGEESSLDSLRPHPNLKELKIGYYRGVSFPSWMMVDKICLSLPNIVTIYMYGCHRFKHLPPFWQLPSLQFLTLSFMDSLEYIDNSISSSGSGSGGEKSLPSSPSSSSGGGGATARTRSKPTPTLFPSLKELELSWLPDLKGWCRSESVEAEGTATATLPDQQQHQQQHYWLPSFPSLSKLTIEDCPKLASMPILQPCLEQLQLNEVSKDLVEQELMMMTVSPTPTMSTSSSSSFSTSSFLHLSKLKSLTLGSIEDLVTLPNWIGNLTSLEQLSIRHCPKLTSLPEGMRWLAALQELRITFCDDVLYDRCQTEIGEDWPKIAHIPYVYIKQ